MPFHGIKTDVRQFLVSDVVKKIRDYPVYYCLTIGFSLSFVDDPYCGFVDLNISAARAGGIDSVAEFTYKEVEVPAGYFFFKVEVKGLKGGHSGGDIHLGRGRRS